MAGVVADTTGPTTVDRKEMEEIAKPLEIVVTWQRADVFTLQEPPLAALNNQTPRPLGALPSSLKSNHLMRKGKKDFNPGEIIITEHTTSLKGSQHQKPTCSKKFFSSFGKPVNFGESYPKTDGKEILCKFSSDRAGVR